MRIGSELQTFGYVEMGSVQFHPLHTVQLELVIASLIGLLIAKYRNEHYCYYCCSTALVGPWSLFQFADPIHSR
jgi:hypothetical protein